MKELLAKFQALSMQMKIVTVVVTVVLLAGVVTVAVTMNGNKAEDTMDTAQITMESTVEMLETESTDVTEETSVSVEETTEAESEEMTVEPAATEETTVEEMLTEAESTEMTEDSQTAAQTEANVPDTSNVNYVLPYIVNGRDIRNGDFDGDGVTDNHGNTWYQGQVFVGSNNVKVRIADGYDVKPMLPNPDAVFRDGTENIEPGSDWQIAVNEYLGRADINNVTGDNLPQVNTVSSKQTTINDTDPSYLAYKAAFDPVWQVQNKGTYVEGGLSMLQTFDKGHDGTVDGIGLIDSMGSLNYMWTLEYDYINGCWKLEILGNYTELIWNSIHNSIRMITPDADAVYNAIYQDCYNYYFESTDVFYPIGNTEVMVSIKNGTIYYYIR